ncbi:MAG: hypothetical protein VW378_07865 [bacterium]
MDKCRQKQSGQVPSLGTNTERRICPNNQQVATNLAPAPAKLENTDRVSSRSTNTQVIETIIEAHWKKISNFINVRGFFSQLSEKDLAEAIVKLSQLSEKDLAEAIVKLSQPSEEDLQETIVKLSQPSEEDLTKTIVSFRQLREKYLSEVIGRLRRPSKEDLAEAIVRHSQLIAEAIVSRSQHIAETIVNLSRLSREDLPEKIASHSQQSKKDLAEAIVILFRLDPKASDIGLQLAGCSAKKCEDYDKWLGQKGRKTDELRLLQAAIKIAENTGKGSFQQKLTEAMNTNRDKYSQVAEKGFFAKQGQSKKQPQVECDITRFMNKEVVQKYREMTSTDHGTMHPIPIRGFNNTTVLYTHPQDIENYYKVILSQAFLDVVCKVEGISCEERNPLSRTIKGTKLIDDFPQKLASETIEGIKEDDIELGLYQLLSLLLVLEIKREEGDQYWHPPITIVDISKEGQPLASFEAVECQPLVFLQRWFTKPKKNTTKHPELEHPIERILAHGMKRWFIFCNFDQDLEFSEVIDKIVQDQSIIMKIYLIDAVKQNPLFKMMDQSSRKSIDTRLKNLKKKAREEERKIRGKLEKMGTMSELKTFCSLTTTNMAPKEREGVVNGITENELKRLGGFMYELEIDYQQDEHMDPVSQTATIMLAMPSTKPFIIWHEAPDKRVVTCLEEKISADIFRQLYLQDKDELKINTAEQPTQ